MNLNAAQLRAVTDSDPYIVVPASPGSGKSRVLVQRVNRMIEDGADPSGILCLTFTSAGALVFKQRLEGISIHYLGTLHGYCFRLLQTYGHTLGYRKGAITICPPEASEELRKEIAIRLKVKITKTAADSSGRSNQSAMALVEAEYQQRLKRASMVDYDGILRCGLKIVKEMRDNLGIEHVLLDETQDAGGEDWAIYDALPGTKFIVADEDQSIYGFRGAKPELFVQQANLPNVTLIKLEQNYRSDILICQAANRLISHNVNRIPKECIPVSTEQGSVTVRQFSTSAEEINTVVREAIIQEGTVAILARTNHLVCEVINTLRSMGVQSEPFPDINPPIDWPRTLLCLGVAMDPNDLVVGRYLRLTKGAVDVNRMKLIALADGKPLHEVAGLPVTDGSLSNVLSILARMGVGEESMALVGERINMLPQTFPTWADLMADLYSHADWNGKPKMEDRIYAGTAHSSKGREWDHVYIIGFEKQDWEKGEIEESRRLAFVAVTRARHSLHLSYCQQRAQQWGKPVPTERSRFIGEIGL